MSQILPIFSTHYSLGDSILTLEPKGSSSPGNPSSIFDLVSELDQKSVYVVDDRIDGFIEGYKSAKKANVDFNFGVKFVVCKDHTDKSDESLLMQSKVIVFCKNTQGYKDLIRIYNRAWTENFYYQGRTSWPQLKELWTENLLMVFPFFSSFISMNTLKVRRIIPSFIPERHYFFDEQNSDLPFESLIKKSIEKFSQNTVKTKSIYYNKYDDFLTYHVYKCIREKTDLSKPELSHFASNTFCWEDYKNLIKN